MRSVFLLQHTYEHEGVGSIKFEETKIIGIYSSIEKVKSVIQKYKTIQGFNKYSEDCFVIDEYKIDENQWEEGFIAWDAELADWVKEDTLKDQESD